MSYRKGDIWKKTRSFAAKQIIPRRVGNFVNPLCEVADEFLEHLESLMDDSGTVADVAPEINKWAFQGRNSSSVIKKKNGNSKHT